MTPFSWHAAYSSELQSVWALLVVPLAFLAWRLAAPCPGERAVVPPAARFASLATIVFALETMLDPIATGPLLRSAPKDGVAATVVPFVFVYLGDLRVLVVALGVARPDLALARVLGLAGAAAFVVPIAAGSLYAALRALVPDVHGQVLWMIYEAGFLALCVGAARRWVPRAGRGGAPLDAGARAFLGALFGYSAAYYALWLAADVVIVIGGLDLGWGIRIVPNQLYYAFWAPFVYFRFFSAAGGNAAR